MRYRIGLRTPLEAGIPGAQSGDCPDWDPEPSNMKLDSFIDSACDIINQQVGVSGDSQIRSLAISAQTADGPYCVDLGSLSGYPDRSVMGVRRAWWDDGGGPSPLQARFLADLTRENDQWANDEASTPTMFAVEGYTLYLMASPSAAGTLKFMCSTGLVAPQSDNDTFQGIPETFDSALLYIAIVQYGKAEAGDAEMAARAKAFTSDAAAGMSKLEAWFNGDNQPQAESSIIFDATPFRRNARRW